MSSASRRDPCQRQACDIQKCLAAHKYQEASCVRELNSLLNCCRQYRNVSKVCAGVAERLDREEQENCNLAVGLSKQSQIMSIGRCTPSRPICSSSKKVPCPTCDKEFNTKQHMNRHLATHQARPCPVAECGALLKSHAELRTHVASAHAANTKCDKCQKTFKTRRNLNWHLKTQHTADNQEKPCPVKGCTVAIEPGRIRKHLRWHYKHDLNEEKAFVCDSCQKTFETSVSLKKHHKRIHEQVKDPVRAKKFICSFDGCQRRFINAIKLEAHTNWHKGQRPYSCDKCDRSYTGREALLVHSKEAHAYNLPKIKMNSIERPVRNVVRKLVDIVEKLIENSH